MISLFYRVENIVQVESIFSFISDIFKRLLHFFFGVIKTWDSVGIGKQLKILTPLFSLLLHMVLNVSFYEVELLECVHGTLSVMLHLLPQASTNAP